MAVDDGYTVALLHMDGADASTTFTDESGKSWTANGNAQIDTAQSKFGGASGLFDGTGDYVSTPDNSDFENTNADFTIDMWVRLNTTGTQKTLVAHGEEGNTSNFGYIFRISSSDKLYFGYGVGGTFKSNESTSVTMTSATWYHIAVVRSSTNLYLFQDGVQVNSTFNISTDSINNTNKTIKLGVDDNNLNAHNGWMDEIRISKGIARWTANFTPPTSAYGPAVGGFGPIFF